MSTTRKLTMAGAIAEAIDQEMQRDPDVFVMGEDIGKYGGIFGATGGLLAKHGKDRIMDTPISETGFIGAAIGAAVVLVREVMPRVWERVPDARVLLIGHLQVFLLTQQAEAL